MIYVNHNGDFNLFDNMFSSEDLDYAWAAGILEGEGCFSIFNRTAKCGTKQRDTKNCSIQLEMTDKDTVERVYNIFKVGSIKGPNIRKRDEGRNRKPTYIWSVQNISGMKLVLEQIQPFMGYRRSEKIFELLYDIRKMNKKIVLNKEQVLEIKNILKSNNLTDDLIKDICNKYNIQKNTVLRIYKGETYGKYS